MAGPAALLVAKTIKINDRLTNGRGNSRQVIDKDALDILRLLQTQSTKDLCRGLMLHPIGTPAHDDVVSALESLSRKATRRGDVIPSLATRAA